MPRKITPPVPGGHKWCHQCKSAKPHSGFYRERRKPDGLMSGCKVCTDRRRRFREQVQEMFEEMYQRLQGTGSAFEGPRWIQVFGAFPPLS